MKKSGMTIVFVVVCIAALVAAYGVGVCIREIRFRRARVETEVAAEVEKPSIEPQTEGVARDPMVAREPQGAEGGPSPERGAGFGGDRMAAMKERFENMSEEEKKEAMAQMRERFGGRRRDGGPQLSDEDRAKMREEMEKLRERSEEMSEEEMAEARAKIFEKYGITPRGSGGRPGGDRGFGGEGGGRRRGRPNDGQ